MNDNIKKIISNYLEDDSLLDKLKIRYLDILPYATHEEWKEWHIKQKQNKPILYSILYTIPNKLEQIFVWPVKDAKTWLKYRVCPRYWRYWFVKPKTLSISYHDPQDLILHCCFQVLVDFFEDQTNPKFGHVDWTYDEKHRDTFKQMSDLYNYWKAHPLIWDEFYSDRSTLDTESYFEKEQAMIDQENEMLHKLINIRQFLWD